jgi:hypothetical protein
MKTLMPCFFALCASFAAASTVTLDAKQVGGFYADGTYNNDFSFQNYFVGYGTTPGFDRTPERRSFFQFDLSGISGTIASAKLELELVFGGLVFGKGPGDPAAGPIPSDPVEIFQLGATGLTKEIILDPTLSAGSAVGVFDSLASTIADPVVFELDVPPPTSIEIDLDPASMGFLNSKVGTDLFLSGWMPSWSLDLRPDPMDPTKLFEASELIFGHSNIHTGYPIPKLTLDVVPEPASISLFSTLGLMFLRRRNSP